MRIACAIEGFLDHCCVSKRGWRCWSSQVCVYSVVIDLGHATSVASSHFSLFLFLFPKIGFMFKIFFSKFLSLTLSIIYQLFLCFFFWFLCFSCSSKLNSSAESHFFSLVISLFFFTFFFSLFFSPDVLPRRSDGRRQDTSRREMSEGSGGTGHQDLKRKSLVGVMWAWLKVWVDGPESTNENASV